MAGLNNPNLQKNLQAFPGIYGGVRKTDCCTAMLQCGIIGLPFAIGAA
jgi:hypothetical protein